MKISDDRFMAKALKLATLGGRSVAPNPMVGAVIAKNGRIIGKGYHKQFGGPHAEVNAINSVHDKKDLIGATMYVTLEPCRHYGKTPPCLGLIENVGITRIICGSHDPFQQKLETLNSKLEANPKPQTPNLQQILNPKHKIIFLEGMVADKCRELNKFFFTWVEKKRPFITVKIAVSADGFVAGKNGFPVHITSKKQDIEVHKLRAAHQAIMVGSNTVLSDNPHLGVRLVKGDDPLRIILDSKNRVPRSAKVFRDTNVLHINKPITLKKLFSQLAKKDISSVLVEPGPTLYRSLKKQGLIDGLIIFKGKKQIKDGLKIAL